MRFPFTRAKLGIAGTLAVASGALVGALPAFAISAADCSAQSGSFAVRAVSISQGDTITLMQTGADGHFEGQGSVEVFCRQGANNLGDIPDAQVTVRVNPTDASIPASAFTITPLNGVPASGTNPSTLGPFNGTADFLISAPSTLLAPGQVAADVGVQFDVVTDAWGSTLTDPRTGLTLRPGTFGDVIAQTPELDSIALFGTGALGLLSYAALRRRARGK